MINLCFRSFEINTFFKFGYPYLRKTWNSIELDLIVEINEFFSLKRLGVLGFEKIFSFQKLKLKRRFRLLHLALYLKYAKSLLLFNKQIRKKRERERPFFDLLSWFQEDLSRI